MAASDFYLTVLYYQCQIYDVKFTLFQNILNSTFVQLLTLFTFEAKFLCNFLQYINDTVIQHIFLIWKFHMSNRLAMSTVQFASPLLGTLFTRRGTIKKFNQHIFLRCNDSHTLDMLRIFKPIKLLSFCCYLLTIFAILC